MCASIRNSGTLPAEDHKFVFVGGLHRSGTTLLARCLAEHPAISGFRDTGARMDEGQHLQSVYPPAMDLGGMGRFGFNPRSHRTASSPLVSQENRSRLLAEWSRYWDLEKPFLLEKSPPNLLMTGFLQAMFPNSYFIILWRHPIPVAFATQRFIREPWLRSTTYSMVKHWVVCHDIVERDLTSIAHSLVFHYETFVRSPAAHLAMIWAFLGLEPVEISQPIRDNTNERYWQKWQRYRHNPLLRPYARRIVDTFEQRVLSYGYSLLEPAPVGPAWAEKE